ncbi:MAG: putative serine protease PepD [Frankiaceae bacterium]|nr:putative serine protease PepD [Frankiaceae bacterium]
MTDERPADDYERPAPAVAAAPSWGPPPADDPWGAQPAAEPSPYAAGATPWGQGFTGGNSVFPDRDHEPTAQYPAATQYPTTQYPATQYPSNQYPSNQYPATQYGGGPAFPSARPAESGGRGRGWVPLLLIALIASLIGGGVGSAFTLARDHRNKTTSTPTAAAPAAQAGQPPSTVRESVPGSVASIAKALLPSVVEIGVETAQGGGTGSGVVIRADGYILTNNHVVGDATKIQVHLVARTLSAKLIGTDPDNDLAVIQVTNAGTLIPAQLGTTHGLKVGDPVIAIGSPLGLAGTVTAGIISALNRRVDVPAADGSPGPPIFGAIQTDAAINPGNSGGALVDGNGKVIGINSAIASLGRSSGTQAGSIGLGFAIPIDLASDTANQLIATGKAVHPFLGVSVGTIDETLAAELKITEGAVVNVVEPGSPADKAGLQRNDVITKLDDTPIVSSDELVSGVRNHKVGETVTITYIRKGTAATAKIVLAEKKK